MKKDAKADGNAWVDALPLLGKEGYGEVLVLAYSFSWPSLSLCERRSH